jgi:hypothetical protein
VAEILVEFTDVVLQRDGRTYRARVAGAESGDGMWRAWIEFVSPDGTVLASGRETTQPNRQDTLYWATGLTEVYLEGALDRALDPDTGGARTDTGPPMPEPVATSHLAHPESVLNPFAAYRKGEQMFRRQLQALSSWHLVNIIKDYDLSEQDPADLSASEPEVLIELIVLQVRERVARETPR